MSSSESILSDQPQAHLLTSRQSFAECVASASLKESMAAEDTFIEHLPVLSGSARRGMAEGIDAPPEDGASIGPSGRLVCDSADDNGQFILTASAQHECRTDHHKAVCVYGGPYAHRSDGRGTETPESIFAPCSYGTGECGDGRAEATAPNHEGQVSQHDRTRKHASLGKYVPAQSADMDKHGLERSTEQRRRNLMVQLERAICGYGEDMSVLPDGYFDVVLMTYVLCSAKNGRNVLDECKRVLAKLECFGVTFRRVEDLLHPVVYVLGGRVSI
ncbi:hypothetical protein HPB52_022982 [Rhipicephalus sanguineus]|uniref:Methyltransferase type 11 domain-containing protein n=1 Tax=Rhipicephalus sanguineus TaxID=34632 RepID=A0A9D4PNJ9_RHISA|nr:hypothetical protein HPB52_022982 [Rhipicephalus sanguineus]